MDSFTLQTRKLVHVTVRRLASLLRLDRFSRFFFHLITHKFVFEGSAADWRLQPSIQYNGYYEGSAWEGYQQNARTNAAHHQYGDMLDNFYRFFQNVCC